MTFFGSKISILVSVETHIVQSGLHAVTGQKGVV